MKLVSLFFIGISIFLALSFHSLSAGDSIRAKDNMITTKQGDGLLGKQLPAFQLTSASGVTYNSEQLKGKLVVMNLWFIACKPCIIEMPELNRLVEQYSKDTNIVFLAPALDKTAAIQEFLKEKEFRYTILPDARPFIMQDLGVNGYPTHLIADASGKIIYHTTGFNPGRDGQGSTVDHLEEEIKKAYPNNFNKNRK